MAQVEHQNKLVPVCSQSNESISYINFGKQEGFIAALSISNGNRSKALIKSNPYFNTKGTVFNFIVVHSISGPPFIPTGFELWRYNRDYVISILKFLSLKKNRTRGIFLTYAENKFKPINIAVTLVGNVVMKHVCKELFAPLKLGKASRAHACHYRSRKVRAKLF